MELVLVDVVIVFGFPHPCLLMPASESGELISPKRTSVYTPSAIMTLTTSYRFCSYCFYQSFDREQHSG